MIERFRGSRELPYFGSDLEEDCFGRSKLPPKISLREEQLYKNWNGPDQVRESKEDLIRFIIENYDPRQAADPEQRFANDLHFMVAKLLGHEDDPDRVRFFSTIRTRLDRYGIDGFFEYDGVVVTLDVTQRPGKDESGADMVISGHPQEPMQREGESNSEYEQRLRKMAGDVVMVFEHKIEKLEKKQAQMAQRSA